MDEFFAEVLEGLGGGRSGGGEGAANLTPPQKKIEETRQNIDKISENVEEAKKLYSVILSAPIPEQSEWGGPMPKKKKTNRAGGALPVPSPRRLRPCCPHRDQRRAGAAHGRHQEDGQQRAQQAEE